MTLCVIAWIIRFKKKKNVAQSLKRVQTKQVEELFPKSFFSNLNSSSTALINNHFFFFKHGSELFCSVIMFTERIDIVES